ncbi:hypothetical protein Ddye_030143 [Dipteronia dyeriana]|uniref:Uncharacterized protein n=1 Tax=Dipteronia dyeriana TaxID=168575 RepID=A0AAD9TG55_9ROSI|nr:hypothetical protein Ddye_030143 [Dipteronia dyeriana]
MQAYLSDMATQMKAKHSQPLSMSSLVDCKVLLDGHDISSIRLKWLREQMDLISQEPTWFATTMEAENMNQVIEAAKAANAHYFIQVIEAADDVGGQHFLNMVALKYIRSIDKH